MTAITAASISPPGVPSRPARRGRLAFPALGAGLVMAMSVPPAGFWPLGLVGLGFTGHLLADQPGKARATVGFCAGVGLYGVTLLWMGQFNAFGAGLVVALEAGFLALAAVVTPPGRWRPLAWPAAILATNALRSVVPFGGLPMGGIDLGQAGSPLAPAARIGGALLVSALVATSGTAIEAFASLAVPAWRKGRGRTLTATAILATIATVTLPAVGAASADGRIVGVLRTAIVQGGGRRGLRAVDNPPIIAYDAQLSADAKLAPPVDLVVWPENVIALNGPVAGSDADRQLAAEATRLGATIVAGITEPSGRNRFFNAAVAWAPQIVARYDKVHRVPFGEYVPGRAFISHLVNLDAVPDDAIAGHGPGLLRTPAGPLGVVISFEVYFSNRARSASRAGGQILLVPTNTASYTTAQVPDSEVAAAKLRAWETGRDVVMAAPTGFSAFITPRGRVRAKSSLGHQQVLIAAVARRTGSTPYVRWGDVPWVVLALVVLAAAWGPGALDRLVKTSKP
jgi:apolipoprotein N-acyltransferase